MGEGVKKPAGKSIAWCVGGAFLGMVGMAFTYPTPTTDQPILGVVRPAPTIEYRDKPVYVVPDSCKKVPTLIEAYENGMLKYSNALGQAQELVGDMRVAILAKDAVTLKKQIEQLDTATGKIYDGEEAPVAEMYAARQVLEQQINRCTKDIRNQTN